MTDCTFPGCGGRGHSEPKWGVRRILTIFLTLNISKTTQKMKNPKTSKKKIFFLNFPKKITYPAVPHQIRTTGTDFSKCPYAGSLWGRGDARPKSAQNHTPPQGVFGTLPYLKTITDI